MKKLLLIGVVFTTPIFCASDVMSPSTKVFCKSFIIGSSAALATYYVCSQGKLFPVDGEVSSLLAKGVLPVVVGLMTADKFYSRMCQADVLDLLDKIHKK